MFEDIGVPIVLTGLFISEDYSMPFTTTDLKRLIREELTATDKTDIERMIRKQLNSDLEPAVEKAVTRAVKAEVQAAIGDKATQKEMADISKKIIKKLYKDLSMHHPYIIDRIKI